MLRRFPVEAIALVVFALVVALGAAIRLQYNPLSGADQSVLDWMVTHRSTTGITVIATLTNLFGPAWVAVAAAIAAVVFVLHDACAFRGVTVVATVAVAGVLGSVLKVTFDRARPPFVDQASTYEASQSFPSGHVTGTTALLVAIALAATTAGARLWRSVAVAVALSISVFAAMTRLYLGMHWFSDVFAAIVLSTAVALVIPRLVPTILAILESSAPQRFRPHLSIQSDSNPSSDQNQESKQNAPVTS